MDSGVTVAIIAACATVVASVPVLIVREGSPLARRNIEKDIQLLHELKSDSPVKSLLDYSISERLKIIAHKGITAVERRTLNRILAAMYIVGALGTTTLVIRRTLDSPPFGLSSTKLLIFGTCLTAIQIILAVLLFAEIRRVYKPKKAPEESRADDTPGTDYDSDN
ncbi:hypothetical protein nbrc107696_24000 [Gordonia spumicola]|uniref:Uncharacterized protein n=1 Tax=Gordonia spumicola TaxID=589161 RepID=A0A7I9V9N5_9ACTN|nr:hypothetical protein [Gordonia spumicola]GEE01954.1 hypothetical protein nbrc107696_24000 [Gordonia spumicola]